MYGTRTRSAAMQVERPRGGTGNSGAGTSWPRLAARAGLSLPGLVIALVVVTGLAIGPLQGLDRAVNKPWSDWILPEWGPYLAHVVDPVASQIVAVPILGVVGVVLAWRRWSWRPVLAGSVAEFGVVGFVGVMKLGLARPSPVLGDSAFFHGGLLDQGWHGISYPSGHAAEAIALYGGIVFLLARFGRVPKALITVLGWLVVLITVVTLFQSFYMEWHWLTDLVGGVLAGAVVLRASVAADDVVSPRVRELYERRRALRAGTAAPSTGDAADEHRPQGR